MAKNNAWNFDTTFVAGDILYASDTSTLAKLNVGTDGEVLRTVSSLPAWTTEGPGNAITGNNCSFSNLAFTLSAGVITMHAADGTALSSTNKGKVIFKSNVTNGKIIVYEITANDTLTISDMTGNTFGTTASVAWGSDMPLYIGFMANGSDAGLEPIVSRYPTLVTSPSASTDIGDPSAANADKETSVFAWNDITEADYTSKNVGIIGSFRATKDSSDVWTATAFDINDGAGHWQGNRQFSMPVAQNGAASAKHCMNNGGTAPTWGTTNAYFYYINREGVVLLNADFGMASSGGSGAVTFRISLPYNKIFFHFTGWNRFYNTSVFLCGHMVTINDGTNVGLQLVNDGASAFLTNAGAVTSSQLVWGAVYLLSQEAS